MADHIIKETFILTLTYEMSVNTDTGELLETRLIDRSVNKSDIKPSKSVSKKKVTKDEDPEPKLFLEDNKFRLNSAALELLKIDVEEGVKLDIRYENNNGRSIPILGIEEIFGSKGGNKLTKSGTVAFRGVKNEELSKYGREFTVIPHTNKIGLFILSSGEQVQEVQEDETIRIEEEDANLSFDDLDLTKLTEDTDATITEIDSNFFKL